jgi:hypothetical protein
VALLNAEPGSGIEETAAKSKFVKGDRRNIITMQEVEDLMFRPKPQPERNISPSRPAAETSDVSDLDSDNLPQAPPSEGSVGGLASREGSLEPEVHDAEDSLGEESAQSTKQIAAADELKKRQEGQRRADQRELVRRAARRLVVFGHAQEPREDRSQSQVKSEKRSKGSNKTATEQPSVPVRRKGEAVMNGAVVEPSFAKGNWAIRWREET